MSGGVGQCSCEEMRPDAGRGSSDHACGHAAGSCCCVEEEQTAEVPLARRSRAEEGRGRRPGDPEGACEGRYDVWSRFARAHLSTEIERAAYLALVGATGASVTAAEIARVEGVDAAELQGVLDRFEAAGIAEAIGSAEGRRYRWRSDMNYVFEGWSDSYRWVDPVCGMHVAEESPYRHDGPRGGTFRFCSAFCYEAFAARPDVFAEAPASPTLPGPFPAPRTEDP